MRRRASYFHCSLWFALAALVTIGSQVLAEEPAAAGHGGHHAGHQGDTGQVNPGQGGQQPIGPQQIVPQQNGQQLGASHHHGSHPYGAYYGGSFGGGYPSVYGIPITPYGYYGLYPYGPVILPPLVVPAETMFGPSVAWNFIGNNVGNVANPPDRVRVAVVGPVQQGNARGAAGQGKPRHTNPEVKARAGKFIQFGDAQFAKGKYHAAVERYRDAAQTAGDLPDGYFRQTFALIANGQYASAAKAMRRGLRIRKDWADSEFELATLYGPNNHLAKTSHREALAQAIEANRQDADLLLLMGVMLHFDGEPERARPFFERAVDMGANEDRLFDSFLAPRPREEQQN